MQVKIDFNRASYELEELLRKKLDRLDKNGLELDIKGWHYMEHAKRAIGLLQGISSDYYSQEEIDTLMKTRDMINKYINELEKFTNVKDTVHF